ncbi:hypothetical protein KUH32_14775 [Thalassococcus sp. CAU 1522]|uniref:DUF465 domain-containing protein n=1 Tax=Thalassococcus arenae TaxID=2851652 RepID=A0ABS6NAG9_9RHOB|nr:hypothetical protein [Thalassococcus arenae]MBV2361026.1 hypothetical protein [Thalassococcus arenae]
MPRTAHSDDPALLRARRARLFDLHRQKLCQDSAALPGPDLPVLSAAMIRQLRDRAQDSLVRRPTD